jgi:hypothetical protein
VQYAGDRASVVMHKFSIDIVRQMTILLRGEVDLEEIILKSTHTPIFTSHVPFLVNLSNLVDWYKHKLPNDAFWIDINIFLLPVLNDQCLVQP